MRRQLGFGVVLLSALIVSGCGGGASSGSTSGTSVSDITKTGTFSLAFSGGAAPGIKHAWLTVYKVAFNADANRPWDPLDNTWKVVTLTTPKTIDIASAGGFIVGTGDNGVIVPVGTYNQIRLFLSPHDDVSGSMPTVADTSTINKTLTYRAQLDYVDGALGSVPIEIPNVRSGLKLDRGVIIETNKWSRLTSHIDVDRSVVRFNGNVGGTAPTADAVTLRPRTFTHGVSDSVGIISGAIDPKYVCGTSVAISGCVSNIVVSAHARTPIGLSGARNWQTDNMENWHTVRVNAKASDGTTDDGSFLLGPFSSTGGNPSAFDVVIRGNGMKTMVFKGVSYSSSLFGTYLGCTWSSAAVPTDPNTKTLIEPVLDGAASRSVALSPSLALKNGRVGLGFILSSGDGVYEVHNANTDPFTGDLRPGAALSIPSASGTDVSAIDYASLTSSCTARVLDPTIPADLLIPNAKLPFSTVAVASYQPFALGTFYTNAQRASGVYTAGATFSVDEPTSVDSATSTAGTVTASLVGLNAVTGGVNRAQLIVSDVGGIVQTMDVSGCIAAASPCPVSVAGLPALAAATLANGSATGVYEFAVRYWNSATPTSAVVGGTMRWARASSFVNLRSATTGTVAITVP